MIGFPIGCTASYLSLSACLVLLSVPQLPVWAQQPVVDWVLGRPQQTYVRSGDGEIPAGGVPLDGYSAPGSFQCLLPPVRGYLTDGFGTRRPGGWTHRGIDYGTYYQSVDVRTPFGGKIVFAGWQGPYGLLVVIENAGWQVYLAHHSDIAVVAGQVVDAAQVVGRSGSTGNSSGHHVHMEFRRWTGEHFLAVNPEDAFLPGQAEFCDWQMLAAP